uniref:Uncharacterized protein n=1 Tax=Arundo donax TaxID=35708 RepID=A0A0A9ESM7_ARUDO
MCSTRQHFLRISFFLYNIRAAVSLSFPYILLVCLWTLSGHHNLVCHKESRIKSHTKLTNKSIICTKIFVFL